MSFFEWLNEYFSRDENKIIEGLNRRVRELKAENKLLDKMVDNNTDKIVTLEDKLQKYLPDPLEEELNSKIPKIKRYYVRQETDGQYSIDVRNYFQLKDAKIPLVTGANNDEKALNALKKVMTLVKYTGDKVSYGFDEYWAYGYQTIKRGKGDCEDGAILLANIMVKSGIPYWRVRLNAGSVWDGRETKSLLKTVDTNIYGDEECRLQRGIDYGTIQKVKQHSLKKVKEEVNQRNLRKALFLGTKEQEKTESLFPNMVGKQLKIGQEFVKNVESLVKNENFTFTTGTKIDSTTLQKIYKYYVALAIADSMVKKGILDNSEKDKLHGIKDLKRTDGSAGHAYVTYCRESDNEFVVLDWCYWPNTKEVKDRPTHKDERNYMDEEKNFYVWFSWNTKYIFGKQTTTEGFHAK